jgi:hypothetical protein
VVACSQIDVRFLAYANTFLLAIQLALWKRSIRALHRADCEFFFQEQATIVAYYSMRFSKRMLQGLIQCPPHCKKKGETTPHTCPLVSLVASSNRSPPLFSQ